MEECRTKCRSEKQPSYSADYFANSYKIPSKKPKFVERFCKKWQNNPQNNLAIFHFCTQYFWCGLASLTPKKTLQLNYSMIYKYEKYLYFHEIVGELQKDFGSIAYKAQF